MGRQLIKISIRNVFRNKRRTILTLFILVLSSMGLVAMGGFFDRLLFLMREAYIRTGTGHLQISKIDYSKKGTTLPFDYLLEDYNQLKRSLLKNPEVKAVVPKIYFGGMLTNEDTSLPVLAMGVDPEADEKLNNLSLIEGAQKFVTMVEGKFLDSSDPNGINISEDMKNALGVEVGDTVYFLTTQRLGSIEGAEFHIRGIYNAPIKELGERMIKMPLATAQKIWDIPDQVHTVSVHLDHTNQTQRVQSQLMKQPDLKKWPLEIATWHERSLAYQQSESFLTRIYQILQFIISVIILFSIANTINMNILERMKEYGTMMAIGCKRSTLLAMIFSEAAFLGLLGGLVGMACSALVALIISHTGVHIPPPPLTTAKTHLLLIIQLSPGLLLGAFGVCFFATLLSSIVPALRAVRYPIVRALGYV